MGLPMNLTMQRQAGAAGDLLTDEDLVCRVLDGLPAIPAGSYPIVLIQSDRFARVVPRVLDVPDMWILPYSVDTGLAGYIQVSDISSDGQPIDGEAAFQRLLAVLQASTAPIFMQVREAGGQDAGD